MTQQKIFVTGGTGFLGRRLAIESLKKNSEAMIWLLLRGNRKGTAEDRFEKILQTVALETGLDLATLRSQLLLVKGDLVAPRFGLSDTAFTDLARSVNHVFHAAASVRFDLSYEKAFKVNVGGTRNVLELADLVQSLHGLERLNYVSTAYVAGKRGGTIYEDGFDDRFGFNNTYEATKFESENLIRQAMKRLPATVFRPSIVMGDSHTGRTETFNVVYAPIKWGYFAKLAVVPGCNRSKIDTVPVNYVTEALVYLASLKEAVIGKTFHLTVGAGKTISIDELLRLSSRHLIDLIDHYGLKNPKRVPKMMHPKILLFLGWAAEHVTWGARRRLLKQLNTYTPYTLFYKEFDNSQARALLDPAGIICPRLQDYLPVLCKYCVDTHFGTSTHPSDVL